MTIKTQKSDLFQPLADKSDLNDQIARGKQVKTNVGTGLNIESSKWARSEKTMSPRYRFTSAKEQVSYIKKIWYIFPFSL
ncbi:hypothetical protein AMR41_05280 [Hapalosiphon sp. MRB220]|nr:hypothetical protein AMR41_05280 [Hapalosiphon sp. MRB220]